MIAGGSRRRNIELRLGLFAIAITVFGYVLVQLAERPNLPTDLWLFVVVMIVLYVVAHLAVRNLAPQADPGRSLSTRCGTFSMEA